MPNMSIREQIAVRATKDEAFRRRITADPRAVLASEYSVHIPGSVQVRVIEDTPGTISIVLPARADGMQELTDEELEAAAAGSWSIKFYGTLLCWGDGDPDD